MYLNIQKTIEIGLGLWEYAFATFYTLFPLHFFSIFFYIQPIWLKICCNRLLFLTWIKFWVGVLSKGRSGNAKHNYFLCSKHTKYSVYYLHVELTKWKKINKTALFLIKENLESIKYKLWIGIIITGSRNKSHKHSFLVKMGNL